jgi:dTDP-4-dehydrorhamnose 3,5-epimerase
MKFTETPLAGAYLVEIEPHCDDRGLFARTYCSDEFESRGLAMPVVQCSVSFNIRRGTLRGMHFQAEPSAEAKLVRCTRGGVYDAIVDVRRGSPTYGRWFAAELTAANHRALYIPPHVAHGFQTLEDESEVFYQMSAAHAPLLARGLRWNDPRLDIAWPLAVSVISPRDASYDDFAW